MNRRAKPRLPPAEASAGPPRPPAKAVIRLERKGRAGKEVTVVERLDLGQRELGEWLRDLKQRLGCGGGIEDGALILQGNQCERVRAYLETRAVRQIRGPK